MDLHPCQVLVVDDIRVNTSILKKILSKEYQVDCVGDGETALKHAMENHVDLILLDIDMPGIDGYEVCKRLKADEQTQNIPIIFITSREDEQDESKGFEFGAVDYITKPFKKAIVLARVRNHLTMKMQRDLLEKMATFDGLTGIPNRRSLDDTLQKEWRRCLRTNTPLSLLMLDVDCFKLFNDHYGHAQGDECLKGIAHVLTDSAMRGGDFSARYGGEEFMIILPDTTAAQAAIVGERVRANVEALNIPHAHSPAAKCVTISVGSATVTPTRGALPSTLQEAADQALYHAKSAGRNQLQSDPKF
jgi:diguanylate cyclase (GGDEF)-like protein